MSVKRCENGACKYQSNRVATVDPEVDSDADDTELHLDVVSTSSLILTFEVSHVL